MKPFWKKVNRGLLLGAVLLVVLLVLIVVQTISFRRAKPVIRQEVKDYVGDLLTVNYAVGDPVEPGSELTAAQKQQRRDDFEAFVKKYWHEVPEKEIREGGLVSVALSGESATGLSSLRAEFENTLSGKQYPVEKLNLQIKDSDLSIRANGPGYAQVSISFSFSTVSGTVETVRYGSLQLEFKRVKGEWKVIASAMNLFGDEEEFPVEMGGQA